ncbi:hypothetical protein V8B97DRAFT_1863528 [Scleroderma yunnanense]
MHGTSDARRPATPDLVLASSLHQATSPIDDLTLALTNFSRVPSPEPLHTVSCCCGDEDCETTKNWLALKSKLESRLILCAEVGSALLRRHEAYVRQHERSGTESRDEVNKKDAEVDARIAELIKENALLEKQLNQALVNNEIAEASNKCTLHELEEERSAVSKLTARHARSVALDARLATVLQENDDIRQERDSEAQRAKLAEARVATLEDRTDKLQAEVRRLQGNLEMRRTQRLESSESLLQEVRTHLEELQSNHIRKSTVGDNTEVSRVLEALVVDNEALRADNEQLHSLLSESREDVQALQAQVEEQKILPPPIRIEAPPKQSRPASRPSSLTRDSLLLSSAKRPASREPGSRCGYEPLTPETNRRPLSPVESLLASAPRGSFSTHPCPFYPTSQFSFDTEDSEYDQGLLLPNQATKAIQTDSWISVNPTAHLTPSYIDSYSPFVHDGRSDSSSLFDGQPSPFSNLLERVMSLLHRMSQADALTLTNRLKRQHLRGADVKHLSRATVGNIISELAQLRAQYRTFLEDEKMTLLCTRRDLRGLFKLFKDTFDEMGQMRVALNDVILEPSIAHSVSEMALDPTRAEAMERERKSSGSVLGLSWMAPFSKLFGTSLHDLSAQLTTSPSRQVNQGKGELRHPRPVVPKIGPALAATTTTVNVEFSGAGAGRSMTNVFSSPTSHTAAIAEKDRLPDLDARASTTATTSNVRSVMDIFAGAPRIDDASDPWVVLPRVPRRVRSTYFGFEVPDSGPATMGRAAARKRHVSHMSRDVDAVLDAGFVRRNGFEEDDIDQTLHRRGLSDSSIHSSFIDHTEDNSSSSQPSVLQTLSRTVQNFKQVASHTISGVTHVAAVTSHSSLSRVSSAAERQGSSSNEEPDRPRPHPPRSSTPFSLLLPGLASWTGGGSFLDPLGSIPSGHFTNNFREEPIAHRYLGREAQGRDI